MTKIIDTCNHQMHSRILSSFRYLQSRNTRIVYTLVAVSPYGSKLFQGIYQVCLHHSLTQTPNVHHGTGRDTMGVLAIILEHTQPVSQLFNDRWTGSYIVPCLGKGPSRGTQLKILYLITLQIQQTLCKNVQFIIGQRHPAFSA